MSGQILVVDGVATNRITLKVRLAAACYDPLTARTGEEVLTILSRSRPALVLIGGNPGDMSSIDLCRQITHVRPGLPVMMMVPMEDRVSALEAGAAALFETPIDDLSLLARIRSLMRHQNDNTPTMLLPGLAEDQLDFEFGGECQLTSSASVMLVADDTGVAMCWRQALASRLNAHIRIADADRALTEATVGRVPDLYLIAADLGQPGDGLRLLSELRSRGYSRNASFAVVLSSREQDMMSIALDLGACDVLPADFSLPEGVDEAALQLTALIRRKLSADRNRQAAEHERTLARIDPLTGLLNRREAMPRLSNVCGSGNACAVVTVDIDCFKRVNDRYGHAAGDKVLVEVADRLDRIVGARGFVARMGGEEFLVALPHVGCAEAEETARQIRLAVSERPIQIPGGAEALRITVSAGLASRYAGRPGFGQNVAAELLARADDALLTAKRAGRDRLIVAALDAA